MSFMAKIFSRSATELQKTVEKENLKFKEEFIHVSQVDAKKGFGGQFGVQKDRVDKSAVGWEYQEKLSKHASQKGKNFLTLFFDGNDSSSILFF